MKEEYILKVIEELSKKLPKLPDGRIDYSHSVFAPVVIIFVKYQDKILLLKRSAKVSTYPQKWSVVAGYLDEPKPIRQKVLEELKEELGLGKDVISKIHLGQSHKVRDDSINRLWLRFPVLVELKKKPKIVFDWEHTQFKWIKPEELKDFDTPPFFQITWEMAQK